MQSALAIDTGGLGPLQFAIADATYAVFPDSGWVFEVKATPIKRDRTTWHLAFSVHGAKLPPPVVGAELCFPEPLAPNEEPNFFLYVFEHEPAYDVRICVLERAEDRFRVRVTGLCDVGWDDEIGEAVPFELHAWLRPRPPRPPPFLVIR